MTDKHVAAVKALVEEYGRYTVKDMANSVGISEGSVHEILLKKTWTEKGLCTLGALFTDQ